MAATHANNVLRLAAAGGRGNAADERIADAKAGRGSGVVDRAAGARRAPNPAQSSLPKRSPKFSLVAVWPW